MAELEMKSSQSNNSLSLENSVEQPQQSSTNETSLSAIEKQGILDASERNEIKSDSSSMEQTTMPESKRLHMPTTSELSSSNSIVNNTQSTRQYLPIPCIRIGNSQPPLGHLTPNNLISNQKRLAEGNISSDCSQVRIGDFPSPSPSAKATPGKLTPVKLTPGKLTPNQKLMIEHQLKNMRSNDANHGQITRKCTPRPPIMLKQALQKLSTQSTFRVDTKFVQPKLTANQINKLKQTGETLPVQGANHIQVVTGDFRSPAPIQTSTRTPTNQKLIVEQQLHMRTQGVKRGQIGIDDSRSKSTGSTPNKLIAIQKMTSESNRRVKMPIRGVERSPLDAEKLQTSLMASSPYNKFCHTLSMSSPSCVSTPSHTSIVSPFSFTEKDMHNTSLPTKASISKRNPKKTPEDSAKSEKDFSTVDDEENDEEIGVAETYAEYWPRKLKLGKKHPDPVVETASLSSVEPCNIHYKLKIPQAAIKSGSLSALQLESITYASQAHNHFLPDGSRAGFLIGDGAGVGKGRSIAGVIYENFLCGRKKALWISISNDLKYDANRDFEDIGAKGIKVIPLNKLKYDRIDANSKHANGVIFSTYSALIGETHNKQSRHKSRLTQLHEWCGDDFDGVIVFDECHKAKNLYPLVSSKATKTGQIVMELQNMCPKARVLYASATGASEPKNMAYMVRLGLWGKGTAFPEFDNFIAAVEKRGVCAMEIVAMDMKLRGMYIARQLSFHGVTFTIEEVPIDETDRFVYDKSVKLWVNALKVFQRAADLLKIKSDFKKIMWAQFWSTHQRFFKYLCIGAKVKHTVRIAKQALETGKCVVIGLQSTGEARTLDALDNEGVLVDFVSTAKGIFESLLQKHFPLPKEAVQHRKCTARTPKTKSNFSRIENKFQHSTDSNMDIETNKETDRKVSAKTKEGTQSGRNSECDSENDLENSDAITDSDDSESFKLDSISDLSDDSYPSNFCSETESSPGEVEDPKFESIFQHPGYSMKNRPKSYAGCMNELILARCSSKVPAILQDDMDSEEEPDLRTILLNPGMYPAEERALQENIDKTTNVSYVETLPIIDADMTMDEETLTADLSSVGNECAISSKQARPLSFRILRMRNKLLEELNSFSKQLPPNTIDELISQLGGPNSVAEMTGRRGRVVSNENGFVRYELRTESQTSAENMNFLEKQRFMSGEKLVAIISEAASSGISLQSDRRVNNRRRRVHITLELPWSADRAVQQFGRTHRSNQVNAPEYIFLISDLAGERRFASTVAKRLESLGALTHGDRRATKTHDLSKFNIDTKFGRSALTKVMRAIMGYETPMVPPPTDYDGNFFSDVSVALMGVGLIIENVESCGVQILDKDHNNITKFLNRILGMPVRLQNLLFEYFNATLAAIINDAKRTGTFDLGILDLGANGEIINEVKISRYLRKHATGTAPILLYTMSFERGMCWEEAKSKFLTLTEAYEGFYLSNTGRQINRTAVLAVYKGEKKKTSEGSANNSIMMQLYRPNIGLQIRVETLTDIERKYRKIPMNEAESIWTNQYDLSIDKCSHAFLGESCRNNAKNETCEIGKRCRIIYVLSGSVLTVWKEVEEVLTARNATNKMQIIRLKTEQGTKLVGTLIPKTCVKLLEQKLSQISEKIIDN